jgi:hypothetical protein
MLIIFRPFLKLVGIVMVAIGFDNPLTVDLTAPEAGPTLLYGISSSTHCSISPTH